MILIRVGTACNLFACNGCNLFCSTIFIFSFWKTKIKNVNYILSVMFFTLPSIMLFFHNV